jgi:hypothetical protein
MTFRTLQIGDQEWKYFVGQKNVVIKYPGDVTRKITASIAIITGNDDPTRFGTNPVQPSDVKKFIEEKLLNVAR